MGSAKLKIGGAWSGVLEVELEEWTVVMLREEVAKRSGHGGGPETINLICAGKLLKDGDGTEKLSQLGVRNNAKILASRVSVDQGKSVKEESLAEEERSTRLSRLKLVSFCHSLCSFAVLLDGVWVIRVKVVSFFFLSC